MVTTMPQEHLLKKLISLGLTGYEAKVYLAMVGRNSLTASEIAQFSGVPRQRVYDVLNSLHLKGLCVEVPGKVVRYYASKPKDALLSMLVERNREFQKKLEEMRETALLLADELTLLKDREERNDSGDMVKVFIHPNQILRKYDEMLLEVEEEVLSMARLPYVQAMAEETYEKVKKGVEVRFLIDEEVLKKEPRMIEAIFRLYGNHEHRFLAGVPLKCSIFDRKKVLLNLTVNGYKGIIGVFIENWQLAEALRILFETLWERAQTAEEKKKEIQMAIAEVRT
ncbi:MAG TPA: TrmB family transcriptional regulator [Thermoplasmata archaeon]|nr:TrmB family transcriptional regulator [Thermoplasmata archaeon]